MQPRGRLPRSVSLARRDAGLAAPPPARRSRIDIMPNEVYTLTFDADLKPCPAIAGLVWAEGIRPPTPSSHAPRFLEHLLSQVHARGEDYVPLEIRQRVRRMLRYGEYKPSGRGKPASEFLLRAALDESFPFINCPVDANNAISLESGFPGSIFDADLSGSHLLMRRGREGETYVFNSSGQTIDLQDLLLVCRSTDSGWEPCGNPVKDAMTTKITPKTTDVLAVLYMPADEPLASAGAWVERYADLLADACGASRVGFKVTAPGSDI
jgi:DNA/RNA-binding domain of Phe-tRNA-synthetase-like protein